MMPTDTSTDTFWAMLEAIGTVLATIVALFSIIYFEIIRPRIWKPSISINFQNMSPYSSLTHLNLGGGPTANHNSIARLIRVGIQNTSSVPAKGVRVKLNALAGNDRIQMQNFIPYDLPWVDIKGERREILAKGEQAYVELIVGIQGDPQAWWLQPYDPFHIGFGNLAGLPETPQPPFVAYIELVAYAENLEDPVLQIFEITYDEPKKLGSLRMATTNQHIERPQLVPVDELLAKMRLKDDQAAHR